MGQTTSKTKLDNRLQRKIDYIRLLLNDDPSIKKYSDQYKLVCEDVEGCYKRFKGKADVNVMGIILDEKNRMLKEAKRKQDNLHKMKLTDIEAFKLKFQRKKKKIIDICDRMVLSGFEVKEDFPMININVPIFCYSNNALVQHATRMLLECKPDHVNREIIPDLAYTVAINYNIVPYHNYTHAFSVAQVFFYMWSTSDTIKKYIDRDDFFIGLIACLGHDLRHPGKNNGYQTARKNDFSCISNDKAVQELMHAATLLKIIYQYNNCNLLASYSNEDKKRYQNLIVKSILATDMAMHNAMIQELKNNKKDFEPAKTEDKEFLIGMMTHCADLSNALLDYDNYIVWSKLITMEFADQTFSEEKAGVAVTPMLVYKGELGFYKGQKFFLGVIIAPQYKEICDLMPELKFVDSLNANLAILDQKIAAKERND